MASWGKRKDISLWWKILSIIVVCAYMGAYYILYPIIGDTMLIVSVVPVLLFFWAFKLYYAIVLQLLLIVHRFIALDTLGIDNSIVFSIGTILGTCLNFILLFTVAYLNSLNKKLKEAENKLLVQNKELIITKNKAEESDRLKTTFISNISHEIRTPLNAIIGFSNLLMEPDLTDEDKQSFFSNIQTSSTRLMQQIDGFIEMSTLMADQIPLIESQFPLKPFMDKLLSRFCHKLRNKPDVEFLINTDIKEGQDVIHADKLRLTQILNVLIDNAIKFTVQGHVKVTYNLNTNNKLIFSVEDTGIGISSKYKDVIFDCFRQGEEGYTRQFEGSGLGLSISKASVELLGGKIWFTSTPSVGSTFYFTIPYKLVPQKKKLLKLRLLSRN